MEKFGTRIEKYAKYRQEIENMPDDGFVDSRDSRSRNVEKVVSNSKDTIGYSDLLSVHQEFSNKVVSNVNPGFEKYLKNYRRYYIGVIVLAIILLIISGVLFYLGWGLKL